MQNNTTLGNRAIASATPLLAPDRSRRLENAFELAPLILLRDHDMVETAETALRTERELLDRQVSRGLLDPTLDQIERLEIGPLGGGEAEQCDLALWHERQRRKAARALVVIFEQEPVVVEPRNQALSDGVVVAFAVPLGRDLAGQGIDRPRIAATEMNAEGDAVEAGNHRIIGLDRTLHVGGRVFAAGAHALERDAVDIGSIARRVDLDVAAAGVDELADDPAGGGDHRGQEPRHVRDERKGRVPSQPLR